MPLRKSKGGRVEPPRFYVYISDAKVDMLLGQIPAGLLKRLAAEVTVDLKIVSVKVATRDAPETRFSRVALVTRYLADQNLIGGVSDSTQYFAAQSAPMRWGLIAGHFVYDEPGDKPGAAFFAGDIDSARVFLTGSPHHILGGAAPPTEWLSASYDPDKYARGYYDAVLGEYDEPPERALPIFGPAETWRGAMDQRPIENLSFVARRIQQTLERKTLRRNTLRVLGSPVWVAASAPVTAADGQDA